MKVKLNSNMITGVLFLIVSVALHILIPSQIRTFETSAVTAATVPTLLIRGMILCSVILLVQGILSKEKTEYTISGGKGESIPCPFILIRASCVLSA